MRVLILGGTQFIGRHIAETLLAAGHAVTILTRGKTPDELPPTVERLRGDRDEGAPGLAALAGRSWDACVDVSGYTPRQVRPSAESLAPRVQRYVFISTGSVYGDPKDRPVLESHPRVSPAGEKITEVEGEMYGRLKVTCENIVREVYGDRCALLRPQIVAGPHDPSGRHTYWVHRANQRGPMLAPGDGGDHVQVIDVRDISRFVRLVIENNLSGAFNLSGPRLMWREFIRALGAKDPVWVPAEILATAGVTEAVLPLYRTERGPRSGLMEISHERAVAAGLTLTDPAATARDVAAWLRGQAFSPALAPEREAKLLAMSRERGARPERP